MLQITQMVPQSRTHDGGSLCASHETTLGVSAGRIYLRLVELTGGERDKSEGPQSHGPVADSVETNNNVPDRSGSRSKYHMTDLKTEFTGPDE